MTTPERNTAYDIKGIFRVEHQRVPHKQKPYEFVRRIGAVTMLPISHEEEGEPRAIIIENTRYGYGRSLNMPAGNMDGGFENPEAPAKTALRELKEETGYGFAEGTPPNISLFRLREVSNTIDYPRFFAVMHGVEYIGGEVHSDHEQINLQPEPLHEYLEPFFTLDRDETYPEVNIAFVRAAMSLGQDAVMDWLVAPTQRNAQPIYDNFAPWLLAQDVN